MKLSHLSTNKGLYVRSTTSDIAVSHPSTEQKPNTLRTDLVDVSTNRSKSEGSDMVFEIYTSSGQKVKIKPSDSGFVAYAPDNTGQTVEIKRENTPSILSKIDDLYKLQSLLENTKARINTLSNGELKLYINPTLKGGLPPKIENDKDKQHLAEKSKEIFTHVRGKLLDMVQSMGSIRDKQRVLVIGDTGGGKSTMLNLLKGRKLVYIDGEVQCKDEPVVKIGDKWNSETSTPVRVIEKDYAYFDCPGFEDTHGPKEDILNAFYINRLVNGNPQDKDYIKDTRIKILAAVEESSISNFKGQRFENFILKLCHMFDGVIKDLGESVTIVFTKTHKRPEDFRVDIDNMLKHKDSTHKDKLEAILKKVRIAVFNLPREGNINYENKDEILKTLEQTKYLQNPTANLVISKDSLEVSRKLIENVVEEIKIKYSEIFKVLEKETDVQKLKNILGQLSDFKKQKTNSDFIIYVKKNFTAPIHDKKIDEVSEYLTYLASDILDGFLKNVLPERSLLPDPVIDAFKQVAYQPLEIRIKELDRMSESKKKWIVGGIGVVTTGVAIGAAIYQTKKNDGLEVGMRGLGRQNDELIKKNRALDKEIGDIKVQLQDAASDKEKYSKQLIELTNRLAKLETEKEEVGEKMNEIRKLQDAKMEMEKRIASLEARPVSSGGGWCSLI